MRQKTKVFIGRMPQRILAFLLAVCMVLTMSPAVMAAEPKTGDDYIKTVTGFEIMSEKTKTQNVLVGTVVDELVLPETLKVWVKAPSSEAQNEEFTLTGITYLGVFATIYT